jgi:hypothetical protein
MNTTELEKDKARLDWLDKQGDGTPWVARQSTTGRGYRLHNSSAKMFPREAKTVREAIDNAMKASK